MNRIHKIKKLHFRFPIFFLGLGLLFLQLGCGGGSSSMTLIVTGQVVPNNPSLEFGEIKTQTVACSYNCETTVTGSSDSNLLGSLPSNHQLECDSEGNPVAQEFPVGDLTFDCDSVGSTGLVEVACSNPANSALDISLLAGTSGFAPGNCGDQNLNISMANEILGLPEQDVQEIADLLLASSCPTLAFLNSSFCEPPEEEPSTFCLGVEIALATLECNNS